MESSPTKEQLCQRDFNPLSQIVLQRMRFNNVSSFESSAECDGFVGSVVDEHWPYHLLARLHDYQPSALRRTMVRMLRFSLPAVSDESVLVANGVSVHVDSRVLDVVRGLKALSEMTAQTRKRPHDPDEIVATDVKRQRIESDLPIYRLTIAQRHRGLLVWRLGFGEVSAMIWERKIHLQQFLNLNPDLGFVARKKIIKYAKFFDGTRIISKKDWLVPPSFLLRYADIANLQSEALGFVNLASSHLAEAPKVIRCSNCPKTMNVVSSDIKNMMNHVSECLGTHDPEQLHGFCACGKLFASRMTHERHGKECGDLQQVMRVIMGN